MRRIFIDKECQMTTTITQAVLYQQLTSCRVVSTTNLTANYANGSQGVGATLINSGTLAALVIDGVTLNQNDRVLISGQTSAFQNGIYLVVNTGSIAGAWVLMRSDDFQNIEQMKTGWFLSIEAGTINAGIMFVVVEPLPGAVGVDPINFKATSLDAALGTSAFKTASDNTKQNVASVAAPVPVGSVATFYNTAGSIQAGGTLGDAAFKGVTSIGSSNLASVTGSFTTNHVAQIADALGTIKDGGILGSAASKNVSDGASPTVSSFDGVTSTLNGMVQFSDTNGSIEDAGAVQIGNVHTYAGGSATFNIPALGVVSTGWVQLTINSQTTGTSYIVSASPGAGIIAVKMSSDPGSSIFGWNWYSNLFGV
jgi:hypothetical protein